MTEAQKHSIAKALGRVVSGVYILTASHGGQSAAMMASWVMQAGFEPPMLTIALAKSRPIAQIIRDSQKLALSIVSAEDKTLMKHYARYKGDTDPSAGIATQLAPSGIPILSDALGYLDCRLMKILDIGADHELCVAEILDGASLRMEQHSRINGEMGFITDMPRKRPVDTKPWKPGRADLETARKKTVPDLIAPGLKVLFVGINPGLYTAAIGHHFGRPGNRFWPALFAGGFTPRLFAPFEKSELLKLGFGITNLVKRATARADELSDAELIAGVKILRKKVRKFHLKFIAIVGITSYRTAFQQPKAKLGRQAEKVEGATVWVLPNPSGLNAHHQPSHLKELFSELYRAINVRE